MRTSLGLTAALFVSTLATPFATRADDIDETWRSQMNNIVKNEVQKTHVDLSRDIAEAKARIQAWEGQRNDAVARAKAAHQQDATGLKLIAEYDRLLATRYVNKKGEFEPGMELSTADVDNLNDLAKTHLSALLFTGRTSAGFARKAIKVSLKRLEDQSDAHAKPSESNNPELEVIEKQVRDEHTRVKRNLALLDDLGLKPDLSVSAGMAADATQGQAPASAAADTPKKHTRRHPAAHKE